MQTSEPQPQGTPESQRGDETERTAPNSTSQGPTSQVSASSPSAVAPVSPAENRLPDSADNPNEPNHFQRVGILYHPKKPASIELATQIGEFLRAQGLVEIWFESAWEGEAVLTHLPHVDLLITLGGDGTLLRAARLGAAHNVPMLGVKMGRLGFLAEIMPDDWQEPLARVLNGDYWVEERLMVRTRVERSPCPEQESEYDLENEQDHNQHHERAWPPANAIDKPLSSSGTKGAGNENPDAGEDNRDRYEIVGEYDALNDVVLSRGALARIVRIRVKLDGGYLTTYTCDGLIVSTATGSTGYALAVHGPILPPELRNILVMPIAPHLSMDRAVVLSEGAEIRMKAFSDHEAMLTVDGQFVVEIHNGDEIVVVGSPHLARFIRLRERNYFYQTLMEKLRWQGV